MKTETITAPVFDEKLAKPVPPTRHEPTARTYCFVQGDALFSATGEFVAVAPKAGK
jgi:hypothetical protein